MSSHGVSIAEDPIWAVVPAAGIGRRMGGAVPKQYLDLDARPVLVHTVERLRAHRRVRGVVVAVRAGDPWWPALAFPGGAPAVASGGEERCHSVLNALERLGPEASDEHWVMVHDAVRPCVRSSDLDRLVATLDTGEVAGAVLGVPVRDTIKRAAPDARVIETVPREGLWRAFTPQAFRLGRLRSALREAIEAGVLVTDEAQAMERCGYRPAMVEGHSDNIKITSPGDLAHARLYLAAQAEERSRG